MRWSSRALLLPLAVVLGGCGVCRQVATHQEAFNEARVGEAETPTPHLRLTIPKSHIKGWEKKTVKRLAKTTMGIPGLGDLARYLGTLELVPRDIGLMATDEGLRVEIDLDVRRGKRRLFGLAMTAVAPTHYDAKRGRLKVDVRADLFESIEPRIEGDAVKGISAAVYNALPAGLGRLIPRKRIDAMARRAAEHLIANAYRHLRNSVLTQLGQLTSFSVSIPRVPLAGLWLRTHHGDWIVEAQFQSPARGLGKPMKVHHGHLRLAMSADAVAHLGNWAMDERHLPARFTEEGRATASGPFRAGLQWGGGRRPLKVHLWTADSDDAAICVRVRAGGRPRLVYERNKLSVGFVDGKLEEVVGPPLFESVLSILGITERVFNYTKKIAVRSRLKLGDRPTGLTLERAAIRGEVLEFELSRMKPPRG